MTLENAGEDQIAHRQRRIERLRRAAAGVAQCLVAGAADPALPSRRRVQAQRQIERRGGGLERLVFGLVVAPVLERILGDHRAGQAEAGGALQLLDPVRDVIQPSVIVDPDDHRIVWAGVEIDGVFRSLDGGDTQHSRLVALGVARRKVVLKFDAGLKSARIGR
jgi:hypothetical protein